MHARTHARTHIVPAYLSYQPSHSHPTTVVTLAPNTSNLAIPRSYLRPCPSKDGLLLYLRYHLVRSAPLQQVRKATSAGSPSGLLPAHHLWQLHIGKPSTFMG